MRVEWSAVRDILVDPVDRTPIEPQTTTDAVRFAGGGSYRIVAGQPVLLPPDGFSEAGWAFPAISVDDQLRVKPVRRGRRAVKSYQRLLRRGIGGQGAGDRFVEFVCDRGQTLGRQRVLIVGGATVGDGCEVVVESPDVDVLSFDVYPTGNTTFVADAHRIPLTDDSVDGVWIQAVLEHVYLPNLVVAEIARVLRAGGYLYAETPFLQPVHEGAYDFQRFSPSAHRLLFPGFDQIAAGPLGGPAAVLALAIRGVVGGLTNSNSLARIASLLCQPIALLDRLVRSSWRRDYATGAYFLGQRRSGTVSTFDAQTVFESAR